MKFLLFMVFALLNCSAFAGTDLPSDCILLEIKQEKYVSILVEPVEGKCFIVADKSGNVRWQTESPYESLLISNGRGVFQFEKTTDGWRRLESSFGDRIKRVVDEVRRLAFGDFGDDYTAETSGNIVKLTPKSSALSKIIKEITVTSDEKSRTPKTIEFVEACGDRTLLRILKSKENPANWNSAFDEKDFLKFKN